MKITALTENTCSCGLPTEHGLSLYIETESANILFDTGQSGLFAENAERLGVDLRDADFCVISHGHYDHGGGLSDFLRLNPSAPVYISRYAFEPYYNAAEKFIGLDPAVIDPKRFILTDGETRLGDGLTLYPSSDCPKRERMSAYGLTVLRGGRQVEDDFRHEQYLLIEEKGRRVLISGCSHKGIINIADRFRPDVLIGGFHLMKEPPGERLGRYARILDSFGTEYYTCHCTGAEQYGYILPLMSRLHYLSEGMSIVISY